MKKWLLGALLVFAGFVAVSTYTVHRADKALAQENCRVQGGADKIIIYAQTGCPACMAMKRELEARGVAFDYLVVDQEPAYEEQLARAVYEAGYPLGRQYGLPILAVNGVLLLDNPPLSRVQGFMCGA